MKTERPEQMAQPEKMERPEKTAKKVSREQKAAVSRAEQPEPMEIAVDPVRLVQQEPPAVRCPVST